MAVHNMAESMDVSSVSSLPSSDARRIIETSNKPIIFEDMISHWPSRRWTVNNLCKTYPDLRTKFRIATRDMDATSNPVMETDCVYIDATLRDFQKWLEGKCSDKNPLSDYQRNKFSCYADYKYMNEIFNSHQEVLNAVDWGTFGFNQRTGAESTLWIGSPGAFTPCHQDTYGCNLIAQLSGTKRWTIFSPEETEKLYPTRIPFEESSNFSNVNVKKPDLHKHPKFESIKQYQVILTAGDVLFLPKHWWHFVENLEPSVSVNTWIEKICDDLDRVKEAITRTLICSLKQSEGATPRSWLNPNEELHSHETNMQYLQLALAQWLLKNDDSDDIRDKGLKTESISEILTTDVFINSLTSSKVMDALIEDIKSKIKI